MNGFSTRALNADTNEIIILVFIERGKPEYPEKNLSEQRRRQDIDPMQKWLPLNYSFVHIQNSSTNLVQDNKFFRIFVSKTRLVGLF